jgi:endoglucanase Acf2
MMAKQAATVAMRSFTLLGLAVFISLPSQPPSLAADVVAVGRGSYAATLPAKRAGPPQEVFKTAIVSGPLPTNRWWSSVLWSRFSERQYPHPLAVRAVESGLQIYYPGSRLTAGRAAIEGTMPDRGRQDLLLEHGGCDTFADARLDGHSDWFVNVLFQRDDSHMRVAYGHGSPYVFANFKGGAPRLRFENPPTVWSSQASGAIVGITIAGSHYGIFGPPGFRWEGMQSDTWKGRWRGKDCALSIGILPERDAQSLKLLARYAYNQVTGTRVRWKYDVEASEVTATFEWTTSSVDSPEPRGEGALFCLYPHQWKNTKYPLRDESYASVRGPLKLAEGNSFTTQIPYHGVLPLVPNRARPGDELLAAVRAEASRPAAPALDSYRAGKRLGKLATLSEIASQCELPEAEGRFAQELKTILQAWLRADDGPQECLYLDEFWGTLIPLPTSHGADVELNDHHLHYGYFLNAAAAIARRESEWATRENWGGMVNLIARDIASPVRDDPQFPFLRCFDPYAGHSWSSGHAQFADGNNAESSSEAIHAWCGLILWGQATGDQALVELGVFLHASEVAAAKYYWFDVDGELHHPRYEPLALGQAWGGKGAFGTWFSTDPAAIYGINWLPFHGGSLYLGHNPAYVAKVCRALSSSDRKQQTWGDLIAMYAALENPASARTQLNRWRLVGEFEEGNSLPQASYWIANLQALGAINPNVRANCSCFAVFDNPQHRTYAVYHLGPRPLVVHFSDGVQVTASGKGFTIETAALPQK